MNKHPYMVVADPLAGYEKPSMIKIIAPAKVNLFLGIGEKRSDGYRDVVTVMHALSLHDVLHMDHALSSEGGLKLEIACQAREELEDIEIPTEDNIAAKAVRLLAAKLGRTQNETISIRIEKHIPHEAGLGGGSSDAAAALLGAANIWGESPFSDQVVACANELGADVAFFLSGGCARMSGRGETIEQTLEPMKKAIVLVKPAVGIPTYRAFENFSKIGEPLDRGLVEKITQVKRAADIPLYNNLAQASENILPELGCIRKWLDDQYGTQGALLCGSGSATFALCETFDEAHHISCEAKKQGWWSRASSFSPLRAALFPSKNKR